MLRSASTLLTRFPASPGALAMSPLSGEGSSENTSNTSHVLKNNNTKTALLLSTEPAQVEGVGKTDISSNPASPLPEKQHSETNDSTGQKTNTQTKRVPEGYKGTLWKKATHGMGAGRWLARFYVWTPQDKTLTYWKDQAAYEKGEASKGGFSAKEFRSCFLCPAEANGQGKFAIAMHARVLELKCASESEANQWVAKISQHFALPELLDDEEQEEIELEKKRQTNNPRTAALCSRFMAISEELAQAEEGSYYLVNGSSTETYELRKTSGVSLTRIVETKQDMADKITRARHDIEQEIAKINVLEKEVASLMSKIRETEDVIPPEDVLSRLGRLLVLQGSHQKRIKELEEQKEVEVQVEVQRVITSLFLEQSENRHTATEQMWVQLQQPFVYALGGDDGQSVLASVERFNAEKMTWELVAPMISKRVGCAAACLDGQIYVMGGLDGVLWFSSAERYDATRNSWEPVASMTAKRVGAAAGVINQQLYVAGGWNGVSYLSSVERFNRNKQRWELASQMLSRRQYCALTVCGGYMYVIGGCSDGTSYLSSVERMDPNTNHWEQVASMQVRRQHCTAAVLNGQIYVTGGSDGSVERYDSRTNRWELMAPTLSKRFRYLCERCVSRSTIYTAAMILAIAKVFLSITTKFLSLANMLLSIAKMFLYIAKMSQSLAKMFYSCQLAELGGQLYAMA
eukprot:g4135.t1